MPTYEVYWGYGALFAAVIAARFVSESALRKLTQEQKAAVLDEFAGLRKYNLLILAGIVFLAISYPESALFSFPVYLLAVAGLTFSKLRKLEVPPNYRRAQMLATGLTLAGFLACFAVWFGSALVAD